MKRTPPLYAVGMAALALLAMLGAPQIANAAAHVPLGHQFAPVDDNTARALDRMAGTVDHQAAARLKVAPDLASPVPLDFAARLADSPAPGAMTYQANSTNQTAANTAEGRAPVYQVGKVFKDDDGAPARAVYGSVIEAKGATARATGYGGAVAANVTGGNIETATRI